MKAKRFKMFNAQTMATGQTYYSYGFQIEKFFLGSAQAQYTGTPSGLLIIQVSNADVDEVKQENGPDPAGNVPSGKWDDYSGQQITLTGAPGTTVFSLTDVNYIWVRLKYVPTSGIGVIDADLCAKSFT